MPDPGAVLVDRGQSILPISSATTWPTGWDLIGHGTLVADEQNTVTIDLTDFRIDLPTDRSDLGLISALLHATPAPTRHIAIETRDGQRTIWRYRELIGSDVIHHDGNSAVRVQFTGTRRSPSRQPPTRHHLHHPHPRLPLPPPLHRNRHTKPCPQPLAVTATTTRATIRPTPHAH